MNRPLDPSEPSVAPYRPTSGRRRVLLLVLAVVTALVVIWLMLQPQLRAMRANAQRKAAPPPPCASGQTDGCVGGTMGVLAPAPAASGPR